MLISEVGTPAEELERAFDRKRTNFLEDYDLKSKPALIWQAWPANAIEVDISSEKLRVAISEGGGPIANDSWWHGFKMSGQPLLVFDGLASTADGKGDGWASEIHADGHLSAGIWKFPESAPGSSNPVVGIADFYVNAFRDFTYLAGKTFEAAGALGAVHLTATMHQADKLALVADPGRVIAPAPKRKTLRWPIATVNAADLPGTGAVMAKQLMRVYGRKVPNP
jgi:hypothetical protein